MHGFRQYTENTQHQKDEADVKKCLSQLPKAYRDLAKGFKIVFEPGNTLKGDDGHIGVIRTHPKKEIRVCSPWNYPRSFAFLHEIGHLVYEKYIRNTKLEKEWERICKSTKNKKEESPEENFCHCFGNHYSKNKIVVHTHPEWDKFMKNLLNRAV